MVAGDGKNIKFFQFYFLYLLKSEKHFLQVYTERHKFE
jgi:hypothetical protein